MTKQHSLISLRTNTIFQTTCSELAVDDMPVLLIQSHGEQIQSEAFSVKVTEMNTLWNCCGLMRFRQQNYLVWIQMSVLNSGMYVKYIKHYNC